jgi:uncharacterized protein (TIGR02217 family)
MPWSGAVLPALPGLGYPPKRSIKWSWEDQTALSGARARYSLFSYPLYNWEIPLDFARTDTAYGEFQELFGFINGQLGGVLLFGYTDPDDNTVSAQSFGTGDGTTRQFQLVRTLGGFTEPVFLLNGAATIDVAGTPTAGFTEASGLVTFNTAPSSGAALTWSGSYYWPVRFDDDTISFEKFVFNMYATKALKFSSEKLA